MVTTWQSLVWKEWHEHKWKLVSIAAVLMGATTLSMLVEERDKLGLAFGMMLMCVIPLAVFVGLGIAANERSRNTLAFLQAQPVPMWHVGLTKLVLGLLTIIVPVMLTAFLLSILRGIFDLLGVEYSKRLLDGDTGPINTGSFFVDITIVCSILAVSLVIWTAAAGVNRKDEVSAGAAALVIIIGWIAVIWTFSWLVYQIGIDVDLAEWGIVVVLSFIPCGVAALFDSPLTALQVGFGVCITTIVHLLLAASYVRRFGQTMERPIVSPKVATRDSRRIDWLDSPRRSPLTAVVWKQFRESVPIAVVGLAAIVGTATVMYASERTNQIPTRFAETYFIVSISLGFCVALVVGIGVALQDMGPQLNMFWRSRPINGSLWFWTKFLTGLIVVVSVIYLPQLLLAGSGDYAWSEYAVAVALVAIFHIATYTAAVAMTCLIRHAVYAAILSVGVLTASIAVVWIVWMTPIWLGWNELPQYSDSDLLDATLGVPMVVTGMVVCLVVSTFTAWLAMRNDWGLKSRF